jgi:hypothetical protein
MQRAGVIVGILGVAVAALADEPLSPPSEVTRCSPNGRYCAVADPRRDAVAIYSVVGGQRTELWAVTPWPRSFDVADDGNHLVICYIGLNLLPLDYQTEDEMLQFYDQGKLVRRWSLRELVPDLGKLKRTASHYEWGNCVGFAADGRYEVRTVDRGLLRFDMGTGRLVK